MRLGRVNAVTIGLLVQLTASCVRSKLVSMYVRQEANAVNYVHVNFYNDTFQRLYSCMTDMNSHQCFVQAAYENTGTPFPGLNNKVINVISNRIPQQVQSSFTCLYSQQATALECTRNTDLCGGNKRCTLFRLRNSPICECVYLNWQYPNEKLVFDNKTDNIEYCKQDCTETTTVQDTQSSIENITNHSTESSLYPSVTSLPSEQSSDTATSVSNSTNIASSGRDESSNTVPVIIGVVLGVFFIAVIVILVVLIYRRKKQTKRQVSNKGNNSSPTNTCYNGGHAQSSTSNIPDVLSTLPSSNHGSETNRESGDGYYTIDKVYGLNRYENELKTVSSKVSQRLIEGVLSSRDVNKNTNEFRVFPDTLHTNESDAVNFEMSDSREGEYFTIDTGKDDGVKYKPKESVLSSRDVNKYMNELRVSPHISHIYEGDAVKSEMSHAREGDYFTIDNENVDGAKFKPIEGVLSSHDVNKYTNELSFSPKISHIYEDDVKSETLHSPEEEYFTLETENDFGEDDTTVDEEQTTDGGYSLAKDVDIIDEAPVVDVIDVSPPPKNVYSKFRDNDNTDMKNPYDRLLEKHQILNPRKT